MGDDVVEMADRANAGQVAREEIDVALDPNLSPTEWRRAGVSLVATLVSEPESSLRALKQLRESRLED